MAVPLPLANGALAVVKSGWHACASKSASVAAACDERNVSSGAAMDWACAIDWYADSQLEQDAALALVYDFQSHQLAQVYAVHLWSVSSEF